MNEKESKNGANELICISKGSDQFISFGAVASSGVSKGKESGETGDTKKSEEKEREKEANKNSKGSNDKVEEASILAVLRRTQHTMSKETSRGSDEEAEHEKEKELKKKAENPEKSLMEEMEAALASEPSLPTGKGKREKQNLIPADVSLKVYTPPLPLDPTFHSEESDDRERNKNTL
ncbi:hypothetical protein NECAME_12974 [Necator americanus]|uniref:Uncharacterized protein n=1 Tax=Necator americanus TaxID=51031 RepID=W2SXH5_NECAM|nr:hypothetical protein NECAME_12974 [Necator americanus]ETN74454.1 hypothetical protein NECAME_12974 [Necator americanus]